MSVKNENAAGGENVVLERPAAGGVYASLFEKIHLNPVSELSALDIWQDAQAMSDAQRRQPAQSTNPAGAESAVADPHGGEAENTVVTPCLE